MIVGHGVSSLVIDDAYLLVYDIATPWYSFKEVLNELLVLRIGKGSSFNAVVDTLDDLAYEHDVSLTLVGGAFTRAPKALSRLYSRHGYIDEGKPSLVKRR